MNIPIKFNPILNHFECDASSLRLNKDRPRIIPPRHFKWIIQFDYAWCYLRNLKTGKSYLYCYVNGEHCASEVIYDGTVKDPIPFKNL